MLQFLEESQIVRDVRENCISGLNIVFEFIKYAIVVYLVVTSTDGIAAYVVVNHIEPFETLGGTWLLGVGLEGLVALAYCALWERMSPRFVGVRFRPVLHVGRDLVLGYLLGIVCIGGSFACAHLLGGFSTQDNLQNVWAWKIAWYVLVYLIQAFGEETLYRGAFMVSAARKNPAWLALLVSSLWFAFQHHHNPGYGPVAFVNLSLLALVCGVTVFATGRIWMATAIHAAWNMFQGKIFGVAVSGSQPKPIASLFMSTAQGNELFSGGTMGLEGSVASTFVLCMVLVALLLWCAKRPRRRAAHAKTSGEETHAGTRVS